VFRSRRSEIRRLERVGKLHSFTLRSGGRYYYDPDRAGDQLWAHCIGLLRVKYDHEMPEEPEILQKIRQAENPQRAMQPFRPDDPSKALVDPILLLQDSSESDPDGS
jgi:hypothetical protein